MSDNHTPDTTTAAADGWKPKAIVFDLLTALLDSWALWDASTPSGTAAEGRPWRARYLELTFGAGLYAADGARYEDLIRRAAAEAGLPASAPAALLRGWGGLEAWPETADVLRRLKGDGYRLGVVTNCSRRLGHAAAARVIIDGDVDKEGKEGPFDVVVTAEESGYYKPDGRAYGAVLDALGVEARDVLFVAGSAGDVEGATAAGMRVVWHNRVGLAKKGEAVALREGRTLDDTLLGW